MRFEEAVERHQHRVFTLAFYLLSNREEAEDVTQEVLLKLWRNRRRVDAERLGGWLLRVTRNASYDLLRSRRRNAARTAALEPRSEAVADGAPDPEARAAAAGFRRRVETAMRALAEPYRSVVILREIQGLAYAEIAEALEMPLNSVRVTLHRARRKLREALTESEDHVAAG